MSYISQMAHKLATQDRTDAANLSQTQAIAEAWAVCKSAGIEHPEMKDLIWLSAMKDWGKEVEVTFDDDPAMVTVSLGNLCNRFGPFPKQFPKSKTIETPVG